MIETIKNAQKNKDTVGGKFKVIVSGVPYGLGSYRTWNTKLNAQLSEAILSINAIKSVEFGLKSASNLYGSELHDEFGATIRQTWRPAPRATLHTLLCSNALL